ncbi:MAG: aminoglycoside phosphotransferase family protein [Chlorogloeopsis fritschii C42_A2020_084]|uniref:phosphotransferase enzyme family protein n=1 Tax=Chlorogloeopsis fritschii TaxID=1124 RepID=UPI001A0FAA34|nr:aminoglycoside phosphotransferase family protein [Chlorogloeopsis fritschii]MBF2004591.1 aminoglycoside phosphotransferase family protein [Chlorogloeopsis fritschii C42_A2020_084]
MNTTEYLKTQGTENLTVIAEQFTLQGKVTNVLAFGSGNINDTFLVTLDASEEKHFILQRINTQVFRQPQLIMQNMRIYTEHVRKRLQCTPLSRRWEVPRVLLTKDAQDHWRDTEGSFWRAISFIEGSQSLDTMSDRSYAKEIGYALGMFHNLISDLPPEKLADTLEGFHITPLYLQHYEDVLAKTSPRQTPEVNYCLQFVSDRKVWAHILEDAKAQGKLPLRLMHGDPKINNVMFDTATHQAVSVIDLDTVKPGLVHYDIGDCLRSGCNPVGEETEKWGNVYFDTELCKEILEGYLSVAKAFLTENDYLYMYDAIRLIAFELGLRFFADYLAGNVYFKIKHPEHNLARALVQFKLSESIESQETAIRKIIQDMK